MIYLSYVYMISPTDPNNPKHLLYIAPSLTGAHEFIILYPCFIVASYPLALIYFTWVVSGKCRFLSCGKKSTFPPKTQIKGFFTILKHLKPPLFAILTPKTTPSIRQCFLLCVNTSVLYIRNHDYIIKQCIGQ